MAVALDGRESYLNEPNDYPSADARMETRPCGLSGDEVWFSRVTESPDALCYNVNIDKPGVYRVDAFFANGTFDVFRREHLRPAQPVSGRAARGHAGFSPYVTLRQLGAFHLFHGGGGGDDARSLPRGSGVRLFFREYEPSGE